MRVPRTGSASLGAPSAATLVLSLTSRKRPRYSSRTVTSAKPIALVLRPARLVTFAPLVSLARLAPHGTIAALIAALTTLAPPAPPTLAQSESDIITEAPPPLELAAPYNVEAADTPNDRGQSITVRWSAPPVVEGVPPVSGYEIWRAEGSAEPADDYEGIEVGDAGAEATSFIDTRRDNSDVPPLENDAPYRYRVVALYQDGTAPSPWSEPVAAAHSMFHAGRAVALLVLAIFLAFLVAFILLAMRGRPLFIRKIAGLSAIEEAVGRATEMGKAVLYVPGSQEVTDIQTIYSMVILHAVAKTVARYGTPLIVPIGKAFVVPLAEETVRQGYLDAGHPEAFDPRNIRYLSDEQFAFTAGIDGIMMREKPAANLFLGSFFAESLILAETGFATGAIQIAGTANIHQLPFFVVACDYALIGEEFFAATAYLSREPRLLGSLKAGDWMKGAIILLFVVGAILMSTGAVPNLPDFFRVE